MRIVIISDIHGNATALEAVLGDIEQESQQGLIDEIVCLGDAIQGGPQPAQVVAWLRDLKCPVVMGNADAWLLTGRETGDEGIPEERLQRMSTIREWSLSQLSSEDRGFIESFRPTIELELGKEKRLLCFHGSPESFDDVILPDISQEALFNYLGKYEAQVMTGGHTHVQYVRRISHDDRFFFNPGSVGFAHSHHQSDEGFQADPWAEYAILSAQWDHLGLEFKRVPFDVDALIEAYRSSGRPYSDTAIDQYRGR
ncbi:MAG: metallophosphoesterase [Chloroflexota bacterium]|nr:MAG: metallophosphoesterase [Chloroflexota bacterium]